MKSWQFILILAAILVSSDLQAADQNATIFFRDAKNYLETIDKAREVKLKDQLEIWKNFLVQYPDTYFRDEIQYNLSQLENILGVKTNSSKELSDTQVFLKAQKYIAKHNLSKEDQIILWKQFLYEHPDNAHKSEVKGMLSDLQFSLKKK